MIDSACQATGVDPEILSSIIYVESGGKVYAHRYEDEFYYKYIRPLTRDTLSGYVPARIPTLDTEKRDRAYSYGLCQILGETARSILHVTHDDLWEILDPELNVLLGATYIATLLEQYAWIEDVNARYVAAVARYNGRGAAAQLYQEKVYKVKDSGSWRSLLDISI